MIHTRGFPTGPYWSLLVFSTLLVSTGLFYFTGLYWSLLVLALSLTGPCPGPLLVLVLVLVLVLAEEGIPAGFSQRQRDSRQPCVNVWYPGP